MPKCPAKNSNSKLPLQEAVTNRKGSYWANFQENSLKESDSAGRHSYMYNFPTSPTFVSAWKGSLNRMLAVICHPEAILIKAIHYRNGEEKQMSGFTALDNYAWTLKRKFQPSLC